MKANEFSKTEAYAGLTNLMQTKRQTLYDLENELVDRIMSGKGKL